MYGAYIAQIGQSLGLLHRRGWLSSAPNLVRLPYARAGYRQMLLQAALQLAAALRELLVAGKS